MPSLMNRSAPLVHLVLSTPRKGECPIPNVRAACSVKGALHFVMDELDAFDKTLRLLVRDQADLMRLAANRLAKSSLPKP